MDSAESSAPKRLRLIQSFRYPNVWSLESIDDGGSLIQIFIDRLDPIGSFAEHNARTWAAEKGHVIADECRGSPRWWCGDRNPRRAG
jgi:hypothetical protein